jgi:hypothetical protein
MTSRVVSATTADIAPARTTLPGAASSAERTEETIRGACRVVTRMRPRAAYGEQVIAPAS